MKNENKLPLLFGFGALAFILFNSGGSTDEKEETFTTSVPIKLTPTNFFKSFIGDARVSEKKTGVPALVTLAQAAIESGYGKSAYGNNFFGIKAGKSWTGETQLLKTWECGRTGDPVKDGISDKIIKIYSPNDPNGVCKDKFSYRVWGKFRKYLTPAASFADHGAFLQGNKRYSNAFNYTDPKQFATEIAKAGYATAPNYAGAIHTMIDGINKILTA